MAVRLTNDTELQTVADAIRAKGGTSANLSYPNGFATAIGAIASAESGCNATAGDILSGKGAWVGSAKVTGTIPSKADTTYNVSDEDQTISSGQYLSGDQTILGVATEGIEEENIKYGVTVKVGDSDDDDGITSVTGTFTGDGDVTAGDILSGKVAYSKGEQIIGALESQGAATYNTSTSDQTIAAGAYLSGAQTIKAVTTSNISAGNIKTGVTVKVGDANSAGRIANVTGTFTNDANAAAGHILSGRTAYVNGSKISGTIGSKGAATYNTSGSDQTITAGQYLSGNQTIKAVKTANISAANIKLGVNVTVGDANSAGRIVNVTGTCAPVSLVSGLPPFYWCGNNACIQWTWHQNGSTERAGEKTGGYITAQNLTPSSDRHFYVATKIEVVYCATRWDGPSGKVTLTPGTRYNIIGGEDAGPQMTWYPDGGSRYSVYKLVSWAVKA